MNSFVTDSKDMFSMARNYMKRIAPEMGARIRLYKGKTPIFDEYGLEAEIAQILNREVPLKSGGSLVIDQTEALVAIDVNTRRYVGRKSQENTILKTNLEAAREVARQLRLRDIGGIIVIDFIDMDIEDHRDKVLNSLRSELGRDRSPTKTCQVSSLGLVEMTRKRVRPSLVQAMSEPCSHCGGTGRTLSALSASTRLERLLERASLQKDHRNLVVSIHPDLAEYLLRDDGKRMEHIMEKARMDVEFHEDRRMKVDEFRVFSLDTHEEITNLYDA
jgi:ribonuclease G